MYEYMQHFWVKVFTSRVVKSKKLLFFSRKQYICCLVHYRSLTFNSILTIFQFFTHTSYRRCTLLMLLMSLLSWHQTYLFLWCSAQCWRVIPTILRPYMQNKQIISCWFQARSKLFYLIYFMFLWSKKLQIEGKDGWFPITSQEIHQKTIC